MESVIFFRILYKDQMINVVFCTANIAEMIPIQCKLAKKS